MLSDLATWKNRNVPQWYKKKKKVEETVVQKEPEIRIVEKIVLKELPRRRKLPDERPSLTHKFSVAGHEGYVHVGLYADGKPGEIFIKMSKEGSTLSGLIQGFCRAFSLALQHGLSTHDAVDRFRGMRFEPMGLTANPEIPEASSILDYVARYLQIHFVERS